MENKIQCCWTEVNKDKHLNQCISFDTKKDLDNHQDRWFCEFHMIKVEAIRYEMYLKMKERYKK